MKAKKFLSVLLAIFVMVTSLLCCGVSASANTGKYPDSYFAPDTLYVDGFWNSEGYYCVRIGNFGLMDYIFSILSVTETVDYLNLFIYYGPYPIICLQIKMDDNGDFSVVPYIESGDEFILADNLIDSARYYMNSVDDLGVVMFLKEDSKLLNKLAKASQVKITAAIYGGEYYMYDNWLTVETDFDGLDMKSTTSDISTLTFSKITDKSYTGKALKPAVTIKDGDKKLVSGTDYTVSYKNNTKIGTATVTITGKGDYTGTKKLTFKIVPKKTTLYIKENSTSKVTLSWKKSAGAAGYQIYCSTNGGSYKKLATVKSASTLSKAISNLNTDKNVYKFKIRSYAKSGSKTFYGSWSNIVSAG